MEPATYVSLDVLAGRIGLPSAWLRREALAGRLPFIRAGRALRFSVEDVEAALRARAAKGALAEAAPA